MKQLTRWMITLSALMLWARSAHAAADWTPLGVGLIDRSVQAIASDPIHQQNLAAISDGILYLSVSGGTLWNEIPTPGIVTAIAYDPTHSGRIWIGMSGECVAYHDSDDPVWHEYGASNNCFVTSLVPTRRGLFFLTIYGSENKMFRVAGDTVTPLSYPGAKPYELDGDSAGSYLYAATDTNIWRSPDQGATWFETPSVGCCIGSIAMARDDIWQLAAGRPFRSSNHGDTWTPVGPAAPTYGFGRLTVHGMTPYFTMVQPNGEHPDIVTQANTPQSGLGLNDFATSITIADDMLIAATPHGVWRYGVRLPSLAKRLRPVIVIPGIIGSWPKDHGVTGELTLDPILHTYDGLLARLRAVGYSETDGSLVPFPYQWRQDNTITARQLAATIQIVRTRCSCDKVDIIAHSMGGLVARSYIESDLYRDDVAHLVELAVPNRGSPLAYPVWENAELASSQGGFVAQAENGIVMQLIRVEGLLKHYASVIDYIRLGIPSIGQLLPDSSYLSGRSYPNGYPANHFLEQLNGASEAARLAERVDLFRVGSIVRPTITEFQVGDPTDRHAWPDGTVEGCLMGLGDGTVPLSSVSSLGPLDAAFDADHGSIVTIAANQIIAYLLGDAPDDSYKATVPQQRELQEAADATGPNTNPTQLMAVIAPQAVTLNVQMGTNLSQAPYVGQDDTTSIWVNQLPTSNPPPIIVEATNTSSIPQDVTVAVGSADGSTQTGVVSVEQGAQSYLVTETNSGLSIRDVQSGSVTAVSKLDNHSGIVRAVASPTMQTHLAATEHTAITDPQFHRRTWRIGSVVNGAHRTISRPDCWLVFGLGLLFGLEVWWLLLLLWRRKRRLAKHLADKT